ncbi:Flp family type IVb pilin [uncultured Porticoccus sp.]|uniref:Flp family type IVb pilin n=1 Tax=uncultured Porticoccus sp. TaxID=1256050 RepID=UPI00261460B6|nr:Flp family type IVb pilin [uncultured Porticoccus sp.]
MPDSVPALSTRKKIRRFFKEEDGASAIEYAIIAGLIAVTMIGTAKLVGVEITNVFTTIQTALQEVNSSSSDTGSTD